MKGKQSYGILAKQAQSRGKLNRLYYVMDMTTFKLELYQSIPMLIASIGCKDKHTTKRIYRQALVTNLALGKTVTLESRYIIGYTEDIYIKCLSKDVKRLGNMTASLYHNLPQPILLALNDYH